MSPKEHVTPVTSPMASDDEDLFAVKTPSKPEAKLLSSSPSAPSVPRVTLEAPLEASKTPQTPTPSKSKKHVRIQAPGSSPLSAKKFEGPAWRASYLSKFGPKSPHRKGQPAEKTIELDSDSDDLEILPPQPTNAMRKLADLARIQSVPSSLKAKTTPTKRQDVTLIQSIKAKQREQILRDRQEKEAELKARGKVEFTKEEEEEDMKEELWDQARREAERIRKREKELAKQELDHEGAMNSDGEEAEFNPDVEEEDDDEEADYEDSDSELVVNFHDAEAEDAGDEEENDEDDENGDEDMADNDVEEGEEKQKVESVIPAPSEAPVPIPADASVSDNEDGEVSLTFKSTKRRRGPIANDEEEDDGGSKPGLPTSMPTVPGAPSDGLLSMSQLFQDSQAPAGAMNTQTGGDKLRAAANFFPTQEGEFSVPIAEPKPTAPAPATQTFVIPTQPQKDELEVDAPPTQLSQFPAPTPMSQNKRLSLGNIWESSDEEEEQVVKAPPPAPVQEELSAPSEAAVVAAPKLRRLKQRRESDNEEESARVPSDAPVKPKKKKAAAKFSRAQAREMADEEAVESDDEWAGLGGNSDDEMDPQMAAELLKMVDDTGNGNEGAADLQKLFAQKERNQDEELVNKLLQDVANGGWRKKRMANGSLLDGLSDEEDEEEDRRRNAYRMRKAKQEARRRGKLIGGNDELSAMSRNPKAKAFLEAIAHDSSFLDSKTYFADEVSDEEENESDKEDNKKVVFSEDSQKQQEASVTENEESQNISGDKVASGSSSPSSATVSSMGPPQLKSAMAKPASTLKDNSATAVPRKKRKLTTEYIRQTLSFIDEDSNAPTAADAAWEPSKTLGEAIEQADLVSDDDEVDMDMLGGGESMLGEPDVFAKPALPGSSSRIVDRRQQRSALLSSGSGGASRSESVVDLTRSRRPSAANDDDDDDDGIVFRGTSFSSFAASFKSTTSSADADDAAAAASATAYNTSYATVTVGSVSTGASGKASINYQAKRKLGVGLKRGVGAAGMENAALRIKSNAVKQAIKQRQQNSIFSQGSWD